MSGNKLSLFQISILLNNYRSIFSPMALACQSVNLGQGFPNFKTPDFIKNAACNAINNDINQYSPPKGLLSLRKALSSNFSPLFGRDLDPENEIIVTAGANEGMYAAFLAFLDEGSEVICFEPFFDQYAPNICKIFGLWVLLLI